MPAVAFLYNTHRRVLRKDIGLQGYSSCYSLNLNSVLFVLANV